MDCNANSVMRSVIYDGLIRVSTSALLRRVERCSIYMEHGVVPGRHIRNRYDSLKNGCRVPASLISYFHFLHCDPLSQLRAG